MSLFDFLDKARTKPEGYKKKLALTVALLLTSIIAFLWFFTVRQVFYRESNQNTAKISSPFSNFSEKVGTMFGSLRETVSEAIDRVKKTTQELKESQVQYKSSDAE